MNRLILLPGDDSDKFAMHHWPFRQVCEEQVGPPVRANTILRKPKTIPSAKIRTK